MTATEVKSGRPADHARIGHNSFWATDWAGHSLTVYLISPRRITHISTQGGSNRLYVAKFSVQFKIQDRTIVDYTEHGKQRVSLMLVKSPMLKCCCWTKVPMKIFLR